MIDHSRIYLASTLGNDPHTEGLHISSKIAKLAGIRSIILEPSESYDRLFLSIKEHRPDYIGLSYRLSKDKGLDELLFVLSRLKEYHLLKSDDSVKIAFAGLPNTLEALKSFSSRLPYRIYPMTSYAGIVDRVKVVLDFFDITFNRDEIIEEVKSEIEPPGISLLDQLADEVVTGEKYAYEPPLRIPSNKARRDLVTRIQESEIPLIRTHFGIPSGSIEPTVDGIRLIAESRVVDEISLGSSDLSQRYFGKPEMFETRKNDGGVPYRTEDDLRKLFEASRTGNYPSMKPYAHVVNLVSFIKTCIRNGLLIGAHQAIPLFWFNELDGRGPMSVEDSIREHLEAVKELARNDIPVEMNDPNQWSSRWAHDTIIVTSYALIASVMKVSGVRNMVFQMQFNKPRETGDYADLAKMLAAMGMVKKIASSGEFPSLTIRETRTGIESLSPDLEKAKWQLARSTLLQMFLNPHIIHLVSFCEANYAARPEDIIESSRIIRRAVRIFIENKSTFLQELENQIISKRKEYLESESEFLLTEIARLNPKYDEGRIEGIASFISNPETLIKSVKKKYMTAPGIVLEKYKNPSIVTKPTRYGFIDLVDSSDGSTIISERERLYRGKDLQRNL